MTDNPYETGAQMAESTGKSGCLTQFVKGFIALCVLAMLAAFFIPGFNRREVATRTQCKNNLKHITVALHHYHDLHGQFPPAFTVDSNGNQLHSWRTLLLPYLERQELYATIDLTKPWNHPTNAAAFKTAIRLDPFRCPSTDLQQGHTTYHAIIGPDAFFSDDGQTRKVRDIKDGTSNTFMITEVSSDLSVHWMDPTGNVGYEFLTQQLQNADTAHTGGIQAALADGSVRFLGKNMQPEHLEAMTTIAGNEVLDPNEF